jgi:predicted phage tail protein
MLTTVILDGEFAKIARRKYWKLECSSPAEAIQLIAVNRPKIRKWIRANLNNYKICEVECESADGGKEKLDTDGFLAKRECKTIRFLPIFTGAGGKNGMLQTIVGAVMIVVGAVLYAWGGQVLMTIGGSIISAGIGLALSGICTMLMHSSKDNGEDAGTSYYFNGAVNTTKQGSPVPLVFGRCRVGSAVISSSIEISDK